MIKLVKHTNTQIVSIQLKDEYAEAYLYLRKLNVNCANILKYEGQKGIYEKARQFKFMERQQNEQIF